MWSVVISNFIATKFHVELQAPLSSQTLTVWGSNALVVGHTLYEEVIQFVQGLHTVYFTVAMVQP